MKTQNIKESYSNYRENLCFVKLFRFLCLYINHSYMKSFITQKYNYNFGISTTDNKISLSLKLLLFNYFI